MNDQYLWDGSGPPDPDVERLEKLLLPLRHNQPTPDFVMPVRPIRRIRVWTLRTAAAAAVLLVAVGTWLYLRLSNPAYDVASVAGIARVEGQTVAGKANLGVGEWLETGEDARARIGLSLIGWVDVLANSRVGVLEARAAEHRLALDRGKIHAKIWAPPGLFFVNTPSAVAVDLGCEYTLQVDPDGAGVLHVLAGRVAFEYGGRESFVPPGAMCAMRPRVGPGTPYFEDAAESFRQALARLDFEPLDAQQRAEALATVLRSARPRDALTVWHLLGRVRLEEIEQVYDRMAELVPPPDGVTKEGVLQGQRHMVDLWWSRLDLGGATWWWRLYKAPWPSSSR